MIVLGVSGFFHHDAAAVLLRDGAMLAAAEEERFVREKHAPGRLPLEAARFCLDCAGLEPKDIDRVAFSYSPDHFRAMRRAHLARTTQKPREALRVLLRGPGRIRRNVKKARDFLAAMGIEKSPQWVPHHVAHAASAFLFSGFDETALFTADGQGELDAGLLGAWSAAGFLPRCSLLLPDSLGMFYSAFTQFLGFTPNDGEYKVMGMAAYGDPSLEDLGRFLSIHDHGFRINDRAVTLSRDPGGAHRLFSPLFEESWGPHRTEGCLKPPDIHIAAAVQGALETAALSFARAHLAKDVARTRNLCLAGGVALNVKMNRVLLDGLGAQRLFVPPAASDAGCALGAAGWASARAGVPPRPLEHAFWGPAYEEPALEKALERRAVRFKRVEDRAGEAASFVADGKVLGWFQGAMEFGPRALGARSILAHPGLPGMAKRVNRAVKDRETWRPFCPAVLREAVAEVTGDDRASPFMTLAYPVRPPWDRRLAEVVHVDRTTRPQTVDAKNHPLFHAFLKRFLEKTGLPAVLNTSFNRAGEPIVNTPEQALDVFFATGLDGLLLGPFLLDKTRL
jgi:carbamoyltransferase